MESLVEKLQVLMNLFKTISGASSSLSQGIKDFEKRLDEYHERLKFLEEVKIGLGKLQHVISSYEEQKNQQNQIIHQLSESYRQHLETLKKLSQSLELIQELALESKIIAFNASLESARQQEKGRAFAVVAQSMVELSQKNNQLAQQISKDFEHLRHNQDELIQFIESQNAFLNELSQEWTLQCQQLAQFGQTVATSLEALEDQFQWLKNQLNQDRQTWQTHLESIIGHINQMISTMTGIDVEYVEPSRAWRLIQERQIRHIIDVRRPDEFNDDLGHIPQARLVTLDTDFEKFLLQASDKNEPHLFVCRSGGRSARATLMALIAGFTKVYNLKGGMLAWSRENLPRHWDQTRAA